MLFNLELDTNNSYEAVGRLLKFYRLRSGYSLRDLGTLTNVSHTLIANIEQGKVKGSDETLKDLYKSLNLEFSDASDVFDDFKHSYDKVFEYLYTYEYTRAKFEMRKLLQKEGIYTHSVLITDFTLLKFLYNAMFGVEPDDHFITIKTVRTVQKNFSPRQKQIYLLIEGINEYNHGMYSKALDYFEKALRVGDSNLHYLVKLYKVKCYVKTYQFMHVIKLGSEVIDFFEERVIYLRAMEVRLSIASAYMINQDYQEAKELLDNVYQFSNSFNAVYLIEEAKVLLASYYFFMNDYDTSRKYLYSSTVDAPIVCFLKMRVALRLNDIEEAKLVYNQFSRNPNHMLLKEKLMIDIAAHEIGFKKMTEEDFISSIEKTIKIGVEAHDIEFIDSGYNFLIRYFKNKRMYKKAFEASMQLRDIRKNGALNYK